METAVLQTVLGKATSQVPTNEKTKEADDKTKERIQDIVDRLQKFITSQDISDKAKLELLKLDPQNLNDYLSIVNKELTDEYVTIARLTSKQLRTILMNFGCYYGRTIKEGNKFEFPEQALFKELPEDFVFPAKSILSLERPRVLAEEYNNTKQILFNNWSISGVRLNAKIPIVFGTSEQYKASKTSTQKTNSNTKILHGGYYCPKGTILLREICKELSKEAQTFFKEDEKLTMKRAQDFFQTFGTIIATEIVVGGELTRNEEVKQEAQVRGEEKNKDGSAQLYGLVQNWLLSGAYAGKSQETNSNSNEKASQVLNFEATGGDEMYITDVTKWIQSLNNPETWQMLRVNKWKYTYEFLPKNIAQQFKELIEAERAELEKSPENRLATHPLNNNIKLADTAPETLALFETCLCAFFPCALHFLPLSDKGKEEKVPLPWEHVRSAVGAFPLVYVSTPQGIFQMDLMNPPVLIRKDFPMCLLLMYDDYLYAFVEKIVKIDLKTKEAKVVSPLNWRKAVSGFVRGKAAYVIVDETLYTLDFETMQEKKIPLPEEITNLKAIVGADEDPQAYIFGKRMWALDLETEKCKLKNEDHKYPNRLCAVYLAAKKEIYVSTKTAPREQDEPVCFYRVQTDGEREKLDVEWDCVTNCRILNI